MVPVTALSSRAHAFLIALGWGGAELTPITGDASFRRYFRLRDEARGAVLMDAPPESEDVRPFIGIARHLIGLGLSAPRVLGEDVRNGILLLEDFGDRGVGSMLASGADEMPIYEAAIAVLVRLAESALPPALAPYDLAALREEVDLFVDWYAPAAGLAIDRAGWDAAWTKVLPAIACPHPAVLVLRDYHVDNLMILDRPGIAKLGLLDFQDALAGHPAYDLVSLLQDARRDVSANLQATMLARYCSERGIRDTASFQAAYETLGAQRNVKILGIFTRLWRRDGKRGYVERMARPWRYLESNLRHPALEPVAAWFAANVPPDARVPAAGRIAAQAADSGAGLSTGASAA